MFEELAWLKNTGQWIFSWLPRILMLQQSSFGWDRAIHYNKQAIFISYTFLFAIRKYAFSKVIITATSCRYYKLVKMCSYQWNIPYSKVLIPFIPAAILCLEVWGLLFLFLAQHTMNCCEHSAQYNRRCVGDVKWIRRLRTKSVVCFKGSATTSISNHLWQ